MDVNHETLLVRRRAASGTYVSDASNNDADKRRDFDTGRTRRPHVLECQHTMSKLVFTRTTLSPPEWQYLKLKLLSEQPMPLINALAFRALLTQALTSTYGLVGSSAFIDVLVWDQQDLVGIVKVADRDLQTLWSSLTLFSAVVETVPCIIEVVQVSGYLMALVCESRRAHLG